MNKLLLWSIISALAGFLFGFDTVVISGAEQQLQDLWNLDNGLHGLMMASALYGTVVGSIFGGWPTEKFGRKKTLLWVGVLFVVGAVGSGFAPNVWALIAARVIGGIGIGVSTVAAPLYISEIAPPERRGRLAGMFQFNIVFGIVVAYASNYLISKYIGGNNDWRWMLGVAAVPSIIYTVLVPAIPESPRWLISSKGDFEGGVKVLRLASPLAPEAQIRETADSIASHGAAGRTSSEPFWSAQLARPILLAFLIAFFNQLSGVNAILYFSKRIFEMTGLGAQASLLQSAGVGVTNMVFTYVGLWLIDRTGRKTLMYLGSFGYIVSLSLVAWAFFSGTFGIVPVCIFAFIAAHAVGQGAVIWVFISEIFPNQHRAAGQTLGSATHWVFAAIITNVFPIVAGNKEHAPMVSNPGYIFAFFGFMMVLQLIWVRFMMPETKGLALEDMEGQLVIKH